VVAPFLPDDEKVAAVREALPALGAGIYLDTGSVGPMPAETAAAMAEIADYELRIGRAAVDYWEGFLERLAEARGAMAAVVGADVDEIGITHSASDGVKAGVSSVALGLGDRIVTTDVEGAGTLGAIRAGAARAGAEVAVVEIGPGDDDERTISAFEAAITPATRLVVASHVLSTNGAVLPVQRIAAIGHERGAAVVVDGSQVVGAIPVNVHDLGVDVYAIAGEKWLLGPEGTGAVWASPDAAADGLLWDGSWHADERIDPRVAGSSPNARRLEEAGHYRPAVTGFARSCGWLSMYVGLPWIHERGMAMARAAAERLARINGVQLLTPRDRMATLVTFRIRGWDADAALDEIRARTFLIARTIGRVAAIRLSVGFFTTHD